MNRLQKGILPIPVLLFKLFRLCTLHKVFKKTKQKYTHDENTTGKYTKIKNILTQE